LFDIEILMQAGEGPSAVQSSLREMPANLASIGEPYSLPWRLLDIVQMARARVTLAEGNAAISLVTVQELMHRWDTIGLVRGSIRTRLLAAAAHTRLGAERDANRLIFEALEMAYRTGHLRVLLDERMVLAASLTSFLQSASARTASTQLREWTNGLLRRLDIDEHAARSTPNSILSACERDVLISLTRGQTNKMIALTCGITAYTVKHHLRHVYRKLKVRRRVQAIEEARRRALIP
jgi:LuxR family maltose regulon positive regulatory protein